MDRKVELSFIEQNVHQFRERNSGHIDVVALYDWIYCRGEEDSIPPEVREYLRTVETLHPISSRQVAAVLIATARHCVMRPRSVTLEHRPSVAGRINRVFRCFVEMWR